MKKIIIITPKLESGVYHHRLEAPYVRLHFEKVADVKISNYQSIDLEKEAYREADIYIFNRTIGNFDTTKQEEFELIEKLKKQGSKIIVDIDDYWILSQEHILYNLYKEHDQVNRQLQSLRMADVVTTTTDYLAKKITPFLNKNVVVIPNAIDPENYTQWNEDFKNCNIPTYGYVGVANAHLEDIDIFKRGINKMYQTPTLFDKWRIAHCGYINGDEPSKKLRIIMNAGRGTDRHYHAIAPRPVHEYATLYQNIDVSLVPLADSEFNRCKSQLKMIEAAYTNTAVICSNVQPYQIDGVHNKNVLFSTNKDDWYKQMKRIVLQKNLLKDLKASLAELRPKYDLRIVNEIRKQIIQTL